MGADNALSCGILPCRIRQTCWIVRRTMRAHWRSAAHPNPAILRPPPRRISTRSCVVPAAVPQVLRNGQVGKPHLDFVSRHHCLEKILSATPLPLGNREQVADVVAGMGGPRGSEVDVVKSWKRMATLLRAQRAVPQSSALSRLLSPACATVDLDRFPYHFAPVRCAILHTGMPGYRARCAWCNRLRRQAGPRSATRVRTRLFSRRP
jgi:hypothetical protein